MGHIFAKKLEGEGALNFILIHNAGGSHQFFTQQIDSLRKSGNVILLDLPGHGSSEATTDNSIEASAQTIASISKKLHLKNICLLGLNNGANIALHTFYKKILPIERLILIDPPLFMGPEFVNEIKAFINKLEQNDKEYNNFIHSLVDHLLAKSTSCNRDIAFNAFFKADKPSLKTMFESLITWDKNAKAVLESITCPTLCVITDEHHCSYQSIKNEAPHFQLAKVVGSKCWATLEVPEQINAMVERFLLVNKENGNHA